jgi:hypothetical protein
MDIAKVQGMQLRRDIFKSLIRALGDAQDDLALNGGLGPLIAVETAGELPETGLEEWWANELHPTPRGFRRIAQNRLLPALELVLS